MTTEELHDFIKSDIDGLKSDIKNLSDKIESHRCNDIIETKTRLDAVEKRQDAVEKRQDAMSKNTISTFFVFGSTLIAGIIRVFTGKL